jgi:hypothetical protein
MATATTKQKELKHIDMKLKIASNLFDLYCKRIKVQQIREKIKPSKSLPCILPMKEKVRVKYNILNKERDS